MKSLLKALSWLIGIALIGVLALVVAVATLNPNDHKGWIIGKVQERTGRSLKLDGDIVVAFYPWLGVELNGVTVGNAPGFGNEPFLKFEHFKARVKLLPLLRDQYEVDTVRLHGAVANLARNKDGVTNWDDLVSKEPAEPKPLPLTGIVLGGVDIQKARLTWSDDATGTRYHVENLTVATGELTYGDPIALSLSLSGGANKPELNADLKLDGVMAYDLDAEKYSVKPLELSGVVRGKNIPGGGTKLAMAAAVDVNLDEASARISDLNLNVLDSEIQGSLTASGIDKPGPRIQADTTLEARDLAVLLKALEVEPLASQVAQISTRSISLKSVVDADTGRGDVDLSLSSKGMLGGTVNAAVKATNIQSDEPAIKGAAQWAGPDLPLLMRVIGQFQEKGKSGLARAGSELAGYPEKSFSLDVEFDADMKSGSVSVPKLDAKLLGASITGDVKTTNIRAESPGFKGRLDASGADLPILLLTAGELQGGKKSALAQYGRRLMTMSNRAFNIQAEFDADMKEGDIDLPVLSVQALGIDASGHLKADNMQSGSGTVKGHLAVSGEKMKELLRALEQKDLAEVLRSVQFEAGIDGSRSDLKLAPMALSAVLAGEQVGKTPVKVELNADTRINLDAESLQLSGLSLQGLGLDVKGNLNAGKILSAPEVSGDIRVAPFSLRQLMSQLNQKPPLTADPQVLRKVALQTQFAGSASSLNLSNLAMDLDDTRLLGSLAVSGAEKRMARFNIDIDQLDADRYLPPKDAQEGAKPVEAPAGEAPARLPVKLLRSVDVQGDLKIGKLKVSGARLSNVRMSLTGRDGKLAMDPIAAQLYQGSFAGNINLDVTGKLPKVTTNAKLQGVQAEPLLADVTGKASRLRGTANFSAALVAAGRNTDLMKQTVNGQMNFSLQNAAIKGYNLGKIMRQGKSLKDSFSLSVSENEETDLS
ncbi:MAG: AsmA family protein, partial [Gammaproteobacteria bacterium]